jgi:hypothetical protein
LLVQELVQELVEGPGLEQELVQGQLVEGPELEQELVQGLVQGQVLVQELG